MSTQKYKMQGLLTLHWTYKGWNIVESVFQYSFFILSEIWTNKISIFEQTSFVRSVNSDFVPCSIPSTSTLWEEENWSAVQTPPYFQLSKWWALTYRLYNVCLWNFTVGTFFLLAFLLIFQVLGRKRSYCRAEERPQVF